MAKETKAANSIIKEVESANLHIMTCETSEKYPTRTNVIVEEDLMQLGEKGEEKVVNQFSIDNYALHVELRAKCRRYLKMTILAGGRQLNAGETAAVLGGAVVTISRKLAHEGDPRKEIAGRETGTYERDVYVTEIISVDFPEEPMFSDAEVKNVIRENNALNKMAETANPFGF